MLRFGIKSKTSLRAQMLRQFAAVCLVLASVLLMSQNETWAASLCRSVFSVSDRLMQTQERLQVYGITTERVSLPEINDSNRPILKITSINPSVNVNGKVISRARERFGIDVYIDPAHFDSGLGLARYRPDVPAIFLDARLLDGNGFSKANPVLLHEIRHAYFRSMLEKGTGFKFAGELTVNEGKTLESGNFYSDFLSLEEISTSSRDLKLAISRQKEMSLSDIQKELIGARRIGVMAGRNLRAVERTGSADRFYFVKSESGHGYTVGLPIKDPHKPGQDLGTLFLDLPEYRGSIENLHAAALKRIDQLIVEADRLKAFAESKFGEFKISIPQSE